MAKSKKEQAFALFDQGRRPSDPEVKELGVKKETLYRYFTYWKSENPSRTETTESSSPTRTGTGIVADKTSGSFIKVVPKVTVIGHTPY